MPDEPAAYYNLGLGFEVQGELYKAEIAYKKAVKLDAKKLYMQALARIRTAIKERDKLNRQTGN